MKNRLLYSFLISCCLAAQVLTAVVAQATPAQDPTSQKPSRSGSKPASGATQSESATKVAAAAAKVVAPDAPVITISGLCAPGATETNCTKIVTKAEFEKLLSARAPDGNIPPQARRGIANEYVQLLTAAHEGQKLGVDKDPTFEERLQLVRTQLLAQGAAHKLADSSKPTQQEVETYYAENGSRFEEVTLRRIYLPKATGADTKVETAKALAEKIRERASAGEDPDKLEAEAYVTLKAPGTPPNTNLGPKRHGAIDARYEKQISALHAGQVSEVLDDPQGYSIYKVESKRMVPLNTVEKEIENTLQRQRFEEKLKQLMGSVKTELNESYFGEAEPSQPKRPTLQTPSEQSTPRKPTSPPKG